MAAPQKTRKSFIMVGMITLAVLVIGLWTIVSFANRESEASLNAWYDRMGLVAESRSAALSAWLNRHLKDLEEIATNATLGMYAGEMIAYGESEQRGYTYNYLRTAATRSGFHEASPLDQVAANVNRPRRAGLGVFKSDGTSLIQTTAMPYVGAEVFTGLDSKRPIPFITFTIMDKMPVLLMGAPIKVVDGMDQGEEPLWLVGARVLKDDFYGLLNQPGDSTQTSENYLVIAGNGENQVRSLSPLKQGGRLGDNTLDPAAAFALKRPGARSMKVSYAGTQVLVTGRELTAPVPWVVVRTVTATEALAVLNKQRNSLILNLSLTVFAVLVVMILVWRLGVSSRLEAAYAKQRHLTKKNEALSQFLQTVSDSQPAAIAAVNAEKQITFANKQLGDMIQLPASELTGRRLETAFTADDSQMILPLLEKAFNGSKASEVLSLNANDSHSDKTMQMDILPLQSPMDSSENTDNQALLVLQDISVLVTAQKQAEQSLKQLVKVLTSIIDARDPWSQHHSARVSEVSPVIAAEMNLPTQAQDTVRTAGQLMNLGKIFVSSSILTKQAGLSEEELALIRESMEKGADLLKGLEFGGPVEQALRQVREHMDGSGSPKGLSGDDIITEAQILSVSNAFVGMVSSRAHRDGMPFDKALDILQQDAGKKYARRVVAALQNVIENKGYKHAWTHYGDHIEEGDT